MMSVTPVKDSFFSRNRNWGFRRISVVDLDDSDEAAEADDYDFFNTLIDTPSSDDEDDENTVGTNLVELYVNDLLEPDKSEHAINMMWNLVCGKQDNTKCREQFSGCPNGANALVQAMRQHCESADLQWKCCSLIIGLSFKVVKSKVALNENGAPEAVTAAMKHFTTLENIQQSGCGALRNLSSIKTHQQYVLEAGSIEAVLAAMVAFPEAPRLQKCGCDCLFNIANSVYANRRPIIKKGGGIVLAETQMLFESKTAAFEREVFYAATEALKVLNSPPDTPKSQSPSSVRLR